MPKSKTDEPTRRELKDTILELEKILRGVSAITRVGLDEDRLVTEVIQARRIELVGPAGQITLDAGIERLEIVLASSSSKDVISISLGGHKPPEVSVSDGNGLAATMTSGRLRATAQSGEHGAWVELHADAAPESIGLNLVSRGNSVAHIASTEAHGPFLALGIEEANEPAVELSASGLTIIRP